jgi:hypothetical protein
LLFGELGLLHPGPLFRIEILALSLDQEFWCWSNSAESPKKRKSQIVGSLTEQAEGGAMGIVVKRELVPQRSGAEEIPSLTQKRHTGRGNHTLHAS